MYPTKHTAILFDERQNLWRFFNNPIRIYSTTDPNKVTALLETIERDIKTTGCYAVGFLSYEASEAFIPKTVTVKETNFPLLWFGLYPDSTNSKFLDEPHGAATLGPWQPEISKKEYDESFSTIKSNIASGYTYQVNLTFRLRNSFEGDPYSLFFDMVNSQQKCFGAYIDIGSHIIISASPELFFTRYGSRIKSKPMKGTFPRGLTFTKDKQNAKLLQASIKNRAENIMIVDMIRNDIGRIAKTGSVIAKPLFSIEKYPTLLQMTSTIQAQITSTISEIFSALFPCGSITGAPKISTMKIISNCEKSPRNIYTGTIGFIDPKLDCQFNVAIRTALIDTQTNSLEFGIGGGIVWDSEKRSEYDEAILKAKVITTKSKDFYIKEALYWDPSGGYFLLQQHLLRLKQSADYFGFTYDKKEVLNSLQQLQGKMRQVPTKVKIKLMRLGTYDIQTEAIEIIQSDNQVKLSIASTPINSSNPFYYHKTSNWNDLFPQHGDNLEEDFLYFNEKGEITESAIANIVVFDGINYFTPPVTCGLLDGTFRNYLVKNNFISEKILKLEVLTTYNKVYLINSVRGWRLAKLSF